jgi:hypothetical protein
MDTLSNSTVAPLLAWIPACPDPMLKVVVAGATTCVPLTERERVTAPDPVPVTWKRMVFQAPVAILALPVATLWKAPPPLS